MQACTGEDHRQKVGDQTVKRILLYNHGGCENRGCEAIVRSTAALFAGKAQILLASDQPEYDRQVGLKGINEIVPSVISPYSIDRLINSVAFRLGASRESEVARKYAPVIRRGKGSICLSIGGDTYCYGRPEHLLVINERLKKAGAPMALWCCSIEPDLLCGELLEHLRTYNVIVARESITYEALCNAGLPALLSCDPAFTLESDQLPLPQGWREQGTVGINVSPLVLNKAKDRDKALDAFTSLIDHILRTTDDAVALIPHVTWGHDSDLDSLGELKRRFADEQRVFMLEGKLNACEVKGYISRLRLLITARTHASIAAYSTCVPTLVIGYSIKARGIARDLFGNENSHLIPVQELDLSEQLIGAYEALNGRAQQERVYLRGMLPGYTQRLDQAVQQILEFGR